MEAIERIFLRRLTPVRLALIVHAPLLLSGLALRSFDAYTHIFLADHYWRHWFSLYEPRWFGGFSVASYPPLVHQLIALAAAPGAAAASLLGITGKAVQFDGETAGYLLVMLAALTALPAAVERFAAVFVNKPAARSAGWLSVGLPSVFLTAYSFGQLPTLAGAASLLWALGAAWKFANAGRGRDLGAAVLWIGVTAGLHHAVLIFGVAAGLAMAAQMLIRQSMAGRFDIKPLVRLGLAGLFGVGCGAAVLWPFLAWSQNYGAAQTPIDHASRHNFLVDGLARYYFFWPMYGSLLLGWPAALAGRRSRRWLLRAPLLILALLLFILGLGGTTPLPAVLFGSNWAWLTYDRFSFWAGLALLPLAGWAWQRWRHWPGRGWLAAGLAPVCLFAANAAVWIQAEPAPLPLDRVADFLAANTTNGDRYLTLGFGDQLAKLSVLTDAGTPDGTYFTARSAPQLRSSGLGALDGALWTPAGAEAILPFLRLGQAWGVRWAFNTNAAYHRPLYEAGWQLRGTIAPGVELWHNPAPWVSTEWHTADQSTPLQGIWWGLAPLGVLGAALGLELVTRWRSWHAAILGLALAAWPFFYSLILFTRPHDFIYYTYTSGVLFLSEALLGLFAVAAWLMADRRQRIVGWLAALRIHGGPAAVLAGSAGLVLAAAALSIIGSLDPFLTAGFALHVAWLGFLVPAVAAASGRWHWRWLALPLTLGLGLQAVIALAEAAAQSTAWLSPLNLPWPGDLTTAFHGASVVGIGTTLRWLRAYGTLPHPNILSAYLLGAMPGPMLGYLKTGRVRWLVPLFLGGAALLLSFSRGAWLALASMLAVWIWLAPAQNRRRVVWAAAGLAAVMALLAVPLSPLVWVRASADPASPRESESTTGRLALVNISWDYFKTRPLTGLGAGAFVVALSQDGGLYADPVHDVPLLALAETGLPGALAIAGLAAGLAWMGWRVRRRSAAGTLFAGALLALAVSGLFDHFLWSQSMGRVWLAVLAGLWLGQSVVAVGVNHAGLAGTPVEEAVQPEGGGSEDDCHGRQNRE